MSLEQTLKMLSQATQNQGRRVQQAQSQPVNRKLINPGQKAGDVFMNPTDNQSRALLEMSLQMLQGNRGESPATSMSRGISKGMSLLDQMREGDRTREVNTAKTGYGIAQNKQDSMIDMAQLLQPSKPPSSIAEYQYAVDQGYKGGYQEFLESKGGGVNVNFPSEPTIGSIPKGYAAKQGPNGKWSMERIAGGPAEAEAEAAAAQQDAKNISRATIAGYTLRDARRIREGIPQMAENGVARWARAKIPGNPEFEVQADISSLQGTIGIEQLLRIKESGAGLGQVPQSQLNLLSRLMGELDIRRDQDRLDSLIADIQDTYYDVLDRMTEEDLAKVAIAKREMGAMESDRQGSVEELVEKHTGGK